jgi:hypothetical protein
LNPNDFFAESKQQNFVRLVGLYSIGVMLIVQASGMPMPAVDAGNIR